MKLYSDTPIVTLWDRRRGYFYTARFTGTPIFQPVNGDDEPEGIPELADAEDHELLEGVDEAGDFLPVTRRNRLRAVRADIPLWRAEESLRAKREETRYDAT